MALSYISEAHAFSPLNDEVDAPTGNQAGDLLVAFVYAASDSPPTETITPPSGWTLVTDLEVSSDAPLTRHLYVFSKITGGSEPATYIFVGSDAEPDDLELLVVRARTSHPTSPIHNWGSWSHTQISGEGVTSPFDVVLPAIILDVSGCLLLAVVFTSSSGWADSPPAGYTMRVDAAGNYLATKESITTGSSGTATIEGSVDTNVMIGFHIAIAPVTVPGQRNYCNAVSSE